MNNNIRLSLIELVSAPIIVASWGIHDINVLNDSISFKVNAMRYQGTIIITDLKEQLSVYFEGLNKKFIITSTSLVAFIDSMIEKSDGYNDSIKEWLLNHL